MMFLTMLVIRWLHVFLTFSLAFSHGCDESVGHMLSLATLELFCDDTCSHGCDIMFVAHIKLIAATCDFFLFIQCSHL
jgi:hypothetical protein